jgi:hypothetical protein
MILYRGSQEKTAVVYAQPVHPSDFGKFQQTPQRVIWASDSPTKAEMMGASCHRPRRQVGCSVSISPSDYDSFLKTRRDGKLTWILDLEKPFTAEELARKVYLYELADDRFSFPPNISFPYEDEYYSTAPQIVPVKVVMTTVGELVDKWQRERTVEIRIRPLERREVPNMPG